MCLGNKDKHNDLVYKNHVELVLPCFSPFAPLCFTRGAGGEAYLPLRVARRSATMMFVTSSEFDILRLMTDEK